MYEQDFEKEFQEFNSAVALFAYVLKSRDKALVETCEQTLISILGSTCTTNVMNAAMFELAESAPETCKWVWQNFPDLEAGISLKEHFFIFTVQKLIRLGFVLGQDFSATNEGTILINKTVKLVLFQSISDADSILIEEIIQVNEQVVFY